MVKSCHICTICNYNMTKDSPDLSSKAVEEAVDETQTVVETQTVHGTLSVDATKNGYEKETTKNPTVLCRKTSGAIFTKLAIQYMLRKGYLASV